MFVGRLITMAVVFAAVMALAVACGDDEATPTATQAPTGTATQAPTGTATQAPTATDVRSQFPADVQPLLADLPDNLVAALWEVRQAGPGTMIWADAGGEFHEGVRRASLAEWEQITGWTAQNAPQATGGTPADFETKVDAGASEWDVVSMSDTAVAIRSVEKGRLEKLDLSLFPVEKFPATSPYTDFYIDHEDGNTPLLYNSDVFSDPAKAPKKVSDIFDTTNFPGKRCLWAFANSGNMEYALLADGVAPDELYATMATKEGRDRAFKVLDTIRDDIVYVESGAESVQFILDGQCDLGLTWNGRPALRLKDEPDLPLVLVHDGAMIWNEPFGIAKGAKNVDAAMTALAYALQPRNQCDLLNVMGYGIVMDAPPFPGCLEPFAAEYGPQPQLAPLSFSEGNEVYVGHDKELNEEWNAWKTGGEPPGRPRSPRCAPWGAGAAPHRRACISGCGGLLVRAPPGDGMSGTAGPTRPTAAGPGSRSVDPRFTPSEQAFHDEFRSFLEANLPPERQMGDESSPALDYDFERGFLRLMGREGWLAPAWPVEYGGRGATYIEQLIFHELAGYYRVPMRIASDTIQFVGPTLFMYGSEEQKRELLPPIARGETWWAQGFSEPESGSDLASLQTRAEIDGDEFVINGTKVWSGLAQHATWYFVLCRTDAETPRHKGLSLILVPMSAPGLTVSPIIDMAGDHYFNQGHFENVRVPRRNLLGELNRGWYAAMTTFDFERSGVNNLGHVLRFVDEVVAYARESRAGGARLVDRPLVRAKLAETKIEVEVARWLCYRVAWMFANTGLPSYESSASKVFITETLQRVYQRTQEILGLWGSLMPGTPRWLPLMGRPALASLWGIGQTIGGGTSEIQRNIVATRGLGLPRG